MPLDADLSIKIYLLELDYKNHNNSVRRGFQSQIITSFSPDSHQMHLHSSTAALRQFTVRVCHNVGLLELRDLKEFTQDCVI